MDENLKTHRTLQQYSQGPREHDKQGRNRRYDGIGTLLKMPKDFKRKRG